MSDDPAEKYKETEQNRLSVLEAYRIMDTASEREYDDLTLLASSICSTPIALISLLDDNRQWFKSAVGLDAPETPIDQAFCRYTIGHDETFVVEDAAADERFAKNPLVTGAPDIRFYAGAPLQTPTGVSIGSLCVIDREPRKENDIDIAALEALARQVVSLLELRKAVADLAQTLDEKNKALNEVKQLQAIFPICSYCKKIRDDENFWHRVDHYLITHANINFSHGICPPCQKRVEAEFDEQYSD